ncbi:MurR/RpiR family transcriptional regulator [Pelosinus propionicus]|uniref:DNA-binding transcriptional regulator, MurR/RpiR family, contains HTH and SIS domains n=1 Tax=Pelosinus propionicus DSM 13327 TaxID=1123291 RepID=A0A1I4K9I4_9FIRM|nr:MurR/RpiR family transcriptional regulator [Pelosinus propionicus]SFL75156.1 DNA-binding transcriptional regulator, MurR/RpiR family, contains HTH and SIS domains [Pelosinus propionicus DSM 13327]
MERTVLLLLREKMEILTSAQRKVADYILKNPNEVAFLTTDQLAGIIGVSVATVMRLAYALGYTGYAQFQKDLQEMLRSRVESPPIRLETNIKKMGKNKLLLECAEVQMNNIKKTVEFMSDEAIENAFNLIFAAKKIYVIGIRGSSSVANYLNEGLNRLGVDSELLDTDSGRLQAILVKLSSEDLVIPISLPRYGKRTIEVAQVAKTKNAKILSITDGYSSPVALLSDAFLACAFESLSFHNSEIGAMFLADFLVTGVAIRNSKKTKYYLEEIEKIVAATDANLLK